MSKFWPECQHILEGVGERGQVTYTYCHAPQAATVSGVAYCGNHAIQNERREKIVGLISQIDANRPQS